MLDSEFTGKHHCPDHLTGLKTLITVKATDLEDAAKIQGPVTDEYVFARMARGRGGMDSRNLSERNFCSDDESGRDTQLEGVLEA
jgi:hypothetical protein